MKPETQSAIQEIAAAAAQKLDQLAEDQATGKTSPVQTGDLRIQAMLAAINGIAEACGVSLKKESIRADGDIPIIIPHPELPHTTQCGQFGEEFAEVLNHADVRYGTVTTKGHVMSQNGWLFINHFSLENLIRTLAVNA
jgi:hypothetical protein